MSTGWIVGAFALGLAARRAGLPPLVGFLCAGFLLSACGVESTPLLEELAHAGVLLLLFAVGLKLRIQNLLRAEVWGTTLAHTLAIGLAGSWLLTAVFGVRAPLAWTLAIAATFSSTVLAAKVLEEREELRAFHGRVAIGILIIQDLLAVALLTSTQTSTLSVYAAAVLALPLARPLVGKLLNLAGHDELLVLYGAMLALAVGGFAFELLGLSGELGALVCGALLAEHRRAQELSNALWGLKEFFLVGFFLSIGLHGLPSWSDAAIALLWIALLPIKAGVFFALLLWFGLRARTAFLTALALASYSEFGLIVTHAAVDHGMLAAQWLVIAALTVALSFIVAAPLNHWAHAFYARYGRALDRFERVRRHPDDEPISFGTAEVLLVGMGRVGSGAYDYLRRRGEQVVGVDSDPGKIERHLAEGRRVAYADAEDSSFWQTLELERLRAIMLAVPDLQVKLFASRQLRQRGYRGMLSATHVYPDERDPILAAGCDVTYNYFTEAGVGFASHTWNALHPPERAASRALRSQIDHGQRDGEREPKDDL
jgi:predicted Kef-type K+ transport protein